MQHKNLEYINKTILDLAKQLRYVVLSLNTNCVQKLLKHFDLKIMKKSRLSLFQHKITLKIIQLTKGDIRYKTYSDTKKINLLKINET